MRRIIAMLTAAALLAGISAGCGSKGFTRVNYDTLYVGQPADAVEDMLGEPDTREADTWTYVQQTPYCKAVIRFKDGRLADKQWHHQRDGASGAAGPGR